jgi:cyclophilin family peptidyl-prolyl cis-trans isomerase/FKBP-type peptidyl-prolyl cis-trans isomerase
MTHSKLPVHRGSIVLLAAALILAACGGDDDTAPDSAAASGEAAVEATTTQDTEATTPPSTTTRADTATTDGSDSQTDTDTDTGTDTDGKPVVEIPAEPPTELVVTVLIPGDGPVAEVGDTVTVNYVGVRSEDGVEFDNSYDRGQPFPLVLGTGSVIQGWDQGLVGAQQGARVQLDIPADLAYGDQARSDVIRANEALTFVVDVVAVEKPPVVTAPPMADPAECPATDGSEPQQQEFSEMQPFCIDVTKTYTAEIETNFGLITVELLPGAAPQNVNNFVTLARYQYFDGTDCHRVLTDFVVQCGDPQGDGFGGPGYTIPDELPLPGEYQPGSIAMANTGQPNSAGSQFFIITGPNGAALPPQYSLFGDVIGGIETVGELNTLENPDGDNGVPPLETITIESVTIVES